MSLVLNSRVAIHTAGWSLLSDTYKPGFQGSYGLLGAVWGTFLITLVAIIIATPVSLFLAVLANDFSIGFLECNYTLDIGEFLSGIPPIIFAAMAPVFLNYLSGLNLRAKGFLSQLF